MKSIRTLIIDDENLAREVIKGYLKGDDEIEIVGECSNGFEGFKLIDSLKPDLVFLDIMMPKLTGFEMLELVEDPPNIIFSTAYDEFAIKAFENNAIDYLLKPYAQGRFASALEKAKAKIRSQSQDRNSVQEVLNESEVRGEVLSRIAVRTGAKIDIISVDYVRYLEAQDDYVKIYSSNGNFLKQQTMKYYESALPKDDFLRIHRSFIVQLKEIKKVEPMGKDTHVVILQGGEQLQVSRSGYSRLREALDF
ncbi:MAG: LytTR family transcriptional regulator DNA-binding domain-containing protein [Ekhidna sp.]|nr:LytTR family transcriptional regulator DNA-binding domain-containing protein [Ekhidna sp.]